MVSYLVYAMYGSSRSTLFLTAVLGALAGLNVYFAYRTLFGRRYIGIIALALASLSPWHFSSSISSGQLAAALFFLTLAIWALAAQRWALWGLTLGLALLSHPAAVVTLPSLAGHALLFRGKIAAARKRILGALAMILIPIVATYGWSSNYLEIVAEWMGVELMDRLPVDTPELRPSFLFVVGGYIAVASAFAYAFRKRFKVLAYGVGSLAIALPYIALFLSNLWPIVAVSGPLLAGISFLAVPALWPVDERRDQISFLLLWLVPPMLILGALGLTDPVFYVLLVPALALLSCRLLDRTVDGQWLDFWWALGLPSSLYHRLSKIVVLGVLLYALYRATRP